jgi:hypothetical protein
MTTLWAKPSSIRQYAEADQNIAWQDINFVDLAKDGMANVETVAALYHLARSPKLDLTYKTWYLECTGFNFNNLSNVITGISAIVIMDRGGRIVDDTIQLTYQGLLIGSNKPAGIIDPRSGASLLAPITNYGGASDTWGVKNLTRETISDSSFGITVRYQSHPHWPHKTVPSLKSIQLQIT